MNKVRLGVIGMSEGNGHPYSWSAICNGYNAQVMQNCPFPVIPEYLSKENFPDAAIVNAEVTHIWTQNKNVSQHIAEAANIAKVVTELPDMISEVDAVLLARDDAENHLEMSRPFLEAGLPVYIDKPLAYDLGAAEEILSLAHYPGQIFCCSAFRFSKEFILTDKQKSSLGAIREIKAVIPKSWGKYAVHIIEPSLGIVGFDQVIRTHDFEINAERKQLNLTWASGVKGSFITTGSDPSVISIKLLGERGVVTLKFQDTFSAFKSALQAFIDGVLERSEVIPHWQMKKVVEHIQLGVVR